MSTKPRYISKQRRSRSCGPTALANILKWYGLRTSHDKMVKFTQEHDWYDPEIGMNFDDLKLSLTSCGLKYKITHNMSSKRLKEALKLGKSVCLLYRDLKLTYHVAFFTGREKSNYEVWNSQFKAVKIFDNLIKNTVKLDGYCIGFIFTKNP